MKELDILLEGYARVQLPGASREERSLFARLLSLPDPQLAAYLLGGEQPSEPELAHLTRLILLRPA